MKTGTEPAPETLPTVRILEIGETGLFHWALPDRTDTFYTSYRADLRKTRPYLGLRSLLSAFRDIRAGRYGLVVLHPPLYPGWHSRSFLAAFKFTVLKGRPGDLYGAVTCPIYFALLRLLPSCGMIAIERSDGFGLPRHAFKCRIFQASTSEVYSDPTVHPQTEEYWGNVNPIGPRSCYDKRVRCAETLFFDYHRQCGLPIKVVRIFKTYGPRMHHADGRVVSDFVIQALRGEPITLYGDGSQTRSFGYVDEIIDGFIRLMDTDETVTGPINLGNPFEFSIRELAEMTVRPTGSRSPIEYRPLPQDDPRQRRPDITRAKETLGWEPKIGLEEGLARTIAYFSDLLPQLQMG